MTLPICGPIPKLSEPGQLTLPGGVTLEHLNLVDIVQPALTPLAPMFNIIEAVVAVFKCIEAIPEALSLPPDPTALLECLPELAEKVDALLRLVPQLSLPYTVVGLFDAVIDALRQARTELLHLQQQARQLAGVVDRAAELEDAGLLSVAKCAEAHIEQEAANVSTRLGSMGQLIGLLNLFLGMLGGPKVPDLSALSGRALSDVIEPLDDLVDLLKAARSAVPLP